MFFLEKMLVLELLGRLGSAVLDCVLDDLRNPIELWSCYQSCSLFSLVSNYIIWYLILFIKIDAEKRSIAALCQCCCQGMRFSIFIHIGIWGHRNALFYHMRVCFESVCADI